MLKFKQILLLTGLLFSFNCGTALANDWVVEINGLPIDAEVKIVDNRSLVPLRTIGESLGLEVDWNENTQEIVLDASALLSHEKQKDTVKLNCQSNVYDAFIDSSNSKYKIDTAVINEENGVLKMFVSPINLNGRIYVPVRLVCDSFGVPVTVKNNVISIGSCFTADNITANKVSTLVYSQAKLKEALMQTIDYSVSAIDKQLDALETWKSWNNNKNSIDVLTISKYVQQQSLSAKKDLENANDVCFLCNETKEVKENLQNGIAVLNKISTDTITNANYDYILTTSIKILSSGKCANYIEAAADCIISIFDADNSF